MTMYEIIASGTNMFMGHEFEHESILSTFDLLPRYSHIGGTYPKGKKVKEYYHIIAGQHYDFGNKLGSG